MKRRKYTLGQRSTVGGKGTLQAKRKQSLYKSTDRYIDAVYNNNKSFLDEHIESFGDSKVKKTIFKNEVKTLMKKKGLTVRQAINEVQRTTLVTSKEERIFESRMSQLKEMDKDAFREFKKKIGWKEKIDSSNATILKSDDPKRNYLRYTDPKTGRDVVIIEEISPKSGISVGYETVYYEEWKIRDNKQKIRQGVSNSPQLMAENDMLKAILEGKEKLGIYRKENK